MDGAATWRVSADAIELVCGPASAQRDAGDLANGLSRLSWGGTPVLERLCSATTPDGPLSQATEWYARGADHVSIHPPSDAFPFQTQLEWSATTLAGGGVAMTLTVSLQTDLLDTRPRLFFDTTPVGKGSAWEPGCELVRVNEPGLGAAAFVCPHPSDASDCQLSEAGGACRVEFSPPFLEKGVIRRGRLAALLLPGEPDGDAVAAAVAEFANQPLPLTA